MKEILSNTNYAFKVLKKSTLLDLEPWQMSFIEKIVTLVLSILVSSVYISVSFPPIGYKIILLFLLLMFL